jgi:hypothetical protein
MKPELLRNYGYGDDITTLANMQILLDGLSRQVKLPRDKPWGILAKESKS